MALMTVGSTALKEPTKYDIVKADLDSENSYTSETGVLVRDMIRANHVTINVSWDFLTETEMQAIASLISNGVDHFSLTYYDYFTGVTKTGTFYSSDRSGNAIAVRRRVQDGYERYSLSTSLIEF